MPSRLVDPHLSARPGQRLTAYRRYGLTEEEFLGTKYLRIKHINKLQSEGQLDGSLRWRVGVPAAAGR